MKTQDIYAGQFDADILVCYGGTLQNSINAFAARIGEETHQIVESTNRSGHMFAYTEHRSCLLWFPSDKPTLATIAHESFHAVTHILTRLDATLTEETEEVYAYFLQWLVKQITGETNNES